MRQGISHDDVVGIMGLFADIIGDICRLGSTWPIFQTPQVGFDLVKIHLELDLMWKRNVRLGEMRETRIARAINHHSSVGVSLQPISH